MALNDPTVAALTESLKEMLECPVCFFQMEPPIEMCKNGHNLCSKCKPNLKKCPICEAEFTNVRNRALEDVADSFLYPCKNQKFGCKVTLRRVDENEHSKVCACRPLECLPFKNSGCDWTGSHSELYEHMKTHKDCLIYDKLPLKLHFFPSMAMNVIRLAKVGEDLFWLYIRQEPENSKYFRGIQYVGESEVAKQYCYSFEMNVGDKMNTTVSFKKDVFSLQNDVEQEYETNNTLANLITFLRQCGCESKNIIYSFNIEKK